MADGCRFRAIAGSGGIPLPITVVIPAYRRPDMVARALRSVHAQTRLPDEVIVVDDASGDETGTRAQELGAQVITHESNLGEGSARNTGIKAARHAWVALLDSDDEWLPHHLATVWPARNGHVMAAGAALGTGEDPRHHRIYGWAGRRALLLERPTQVALPENRVCPSAALIKRDTAIDAGGFRDLPRAADLDMWIRMLELGSAVAMPLITALYHVHAGQVSVDPGPMHRAHADVLSRHRGRAIPAEALRRHEGVVAWDTARAALAGGAPPVSAARELATAMLSARGIVGVAQLLLSRFRGRRMAARLAPGGGPSVVLLPGSEPALDTAPGVADLRPLGYVRAFAHIVREPPARAHVGGHASAAVARALGIEPVSAP